MNGVSVSDQICSEFVEVDPTGRYGRYNEILGKGASKTVYRGFDEYEGIEVAWNQVKLHDFLQNPEDLERLYCEIHLLKTLKHKNIMKFYTSWVDTSNRNINFVTEMFTSGTLRQYRLKHRRVNIRAVKHWCRQILKGLLYLHSLNPPVIHRDLKCDNIFINGNQGQVKIGDLGLAAILRKSHAARCVVGTPEFMAPEVYEEEYNELVDIYAFGMCVLEMVTFEYPYSECTHAAQIYKKVISGKKPEALYKVEDLEVRRFVEKCLATVSCRLTARELLEDRFLQMDDYGYEATEFDEMSYYGIHQNRRSLVDSYGCYLGYDDPANDLDYNPVEYKTSEIYLFPCSEEDDKHLGDFEITIQGRRREDDGIFLRLRIADKDGRIRNIYFPFDIENDTALSVATEMVNELDITDQDVTKIADMIDGEISSLVPEWKTGFQSLCHNCTSNGSPIIEYVASENQGSKTLQVLECSKHGCASIHGRFEEITYQVDEPSCHSNGSHYTDIWAQRDGRESSSELSTRDIFCDEKNDTSKCHSRSASLNERGNAIRQELRWLKAKYQLQLRELRDQQLRLDPKLPSLVTSLDRAEHSKDYDDDELSMSFKLEPCLSLKVFGSGFAGESEKRCSDLEGLKESYSNEEQMFTAKRFYSADFLPQTLHRATSLPVDAIDF